MMKRLYLALYFLISPSLVFGDLAYIGDLADIAPALRVDNWLASYWCPECNQWHVGGSCVHASLLALMNYHGMDNWADRWQSTYAGGGETESSIIDKAKAINLPFAAASGGNVAFLEWCSRNRLGAIIWWKPSHCCTLVDLNDQYAVILDNNAIGQYEYVPRQQFLSMWRGYGGFAMTVLAPPPPPWPTLPKYLKK